MLRVGCLKDISWLIPLNLSTDDQLLLYSACDSVYVDYAVSLIRSVDVFSPGFVFLLHLINPDKDVLERIIQLPNLLLDTRLSVSTEYKNLSKFTQEERRTYFACARFLHLAELLPKLNIAVLCLDADSLIVNNIDLDFTDKPKAEVCLVRRDLDANVAEEVAVATGSIWMRPLSEVHRLITNVAKEIEQAFANKSASWFIDQITFYRQIKLLGSEVQVRNIKRKYADWDFRDASIVWTGKGDRKHLDLRYLIIQRLLSDKYSVQTKALQLYKTICDSLSNSVSFQQKVEKLFEVINPRVTLYLPRLDLPWKKSKNVNQIPPEMTDDTLSLRLHWKSFTTHLANAIERVGISVDVIEIPAWEINRDTVEANGANLALIPHRCSHDFETGETQVLFFMQEFFRWTFIIDENGWSAASSIYPIDLDSIQKISTGSFDDYRKRLVAGELSSKFSQKSHINRKKLVKTKQIPNRPYIFFPLQIPHDQSIDYFSDVTELEVVESLLNWAEKEDIPVVLKPHPVNMKSMKPFEELFQRSKPVSGKSSWIPFKKGQCLYWSTAHVHDLIEHAKAVYTINSGVGFEALLHLKPVVTFGRVEYDCVTFNANLKNFDEAWKYCEGDGAQLLEPRYRQFFDWFLGEYVFDLTQPEQLKTRLEEIAAQIYAKVNQ